MQTVNRKGPAAKAGVEPGDVIVEFNGKPIKNNNELVAMVSAMKPGSTVPLKVIREKQSKTLNVTLEELNLDSETAARETPDTSSNDQEQTSKGFGASHSGTSRQRFRAACAWTTTSRAQ